MSTTEEFKRKLEEMKRVSFKAIHPQYCSMMRLLDPIWEDLILKAKYKPVLEVVSEKQIITFGTHQSELSVLCPVRVECRYDSSVEHNVRVSVCGQNLSFAEGSTNLMRSKQGNIVALFNRDHVEVVVVRTRIQFANTIIGFKLIEFAMEKENVYGVKRIFYIDEETCNPVFIALYDGVQIAETRIYNFESQAYLSLNGSTLLQSGFNMNVSEIAEHPLPTELKGALLWDRDDRVFQEFVQYIRGGFQSLPLD